MVSMKPGLFLLFMLAAASGVDARVMPSGSTDIAYENLPHPTHAGYLPVSNTFNSAIYYMYFEADEPHPDVKTAPIILWLQVGLTFRSATVWMLQQSGVQQDNALQCALHRHVQTDMHAFLPFAAVLKMENPTASIHVRCPLATVPQAMLTWQWRMACREVQDAPAFLEHFI